MGKVILILVDGMRPDGLMQCGNPRLEKLLEGSSYTLGARTVMPSVTLPCHMSLFHSVDPDRHGIICNTYTPMVRPMEGLFERLKAAGKKSGFYYSWEQLRDLARFDTLNESLLKNLHQQPDTDKTLTARAVEYIKAESPDFMFLYMGETDEVGHKYGWMSPEYLAKISSAVDNVLALDEAFADEYTLILIADHGGHGRGHGSDMAEDMTIPVVFRGAGVSGRELGEVSIKDIAPTIASITGATPADEWEGKIVEF
ncbi:MAG: alkaline phosphatase family protein [Clostridia bacterium]|nr:alkaline phosphatase family protein [Clostridia bacterium]